MKPALLLIDLQADYLAEEKLQPSAGQIVERSAALLAGCRAAAIPVVHVWTTVSRNEDRRMPHWKRAGRWRCVEGTPGHQPPAPLIPMPSENVVHKEFFSAFSSRTLLETLQRVGADTLLVAGIHLHACVRATVLDAYQYGFEILVAQDAVGSDDPLHAAISFRYLDARAARFLSVAELLKILPAQAPVTIRGESSSSKISRVCGSARDAWTRWSGSEISQRRALLERLAARLQANTSALADAMARDIGKPVHYGRIEVERAAELVRAIARNDFCQSGDHLPGFRRRPLGVVAVITPWNNPVLIPLGKIAAALFYGNTVVWKPAPQAAGAAKWIMEILNALNFPHDIINVIEGDHHCAMALMSDANVDAVTLTGGALAGYSAQEICARRHIPLQAELGGNNAAIVWNDADLKLAAERIAEGAFGQAGQRCTANRRAIAHADCYNEFLSLVERATALLPCGDPFDLNTRIGPLVSRGQRERITELIDRVRSTGARVILPQKSIDAEFDPGRFHAPVIVCCEDPRHEIVQEETFGPVLVVQRASNWEQAMQLCNGVRQGLIAALFSRSSEFHQRFLAEARAGVLKINQATADVAVHLPFGGWKSSGVGPPEHGVADQEFFTRLQAVYVAENR